MKRCKRTRGAVNEDRISQLPEALILQILSLLPTKDVIATSALSKQWQSLWKTVPTLMFDYSDHERRKLGAFSKDVCRYLLSHKAPILQSLHLEVDLGTCTATDIGVFLGIAFGRNVRKLLLDVYSNNSRPFNFPPTLLCTCETLETLILRFHALVDVPSQICLKSLKTLHLDYMDYKDDKSVRNLLSGCPCLETLVVKRSTLGDYKTFIIEVPSLQSLSIHDENDGVDHWGYVIKTPSLKYLHIDMVEKGPEVCLSENSLAEAKISCVTINEKLLGSLTSVKMLSLLFWSPLEVKYPTGSIFYRLVNLEIYTGKPAWWNLLMFMLNTSPKLKVLKLLIDHQWHEIEDHVVCEKWNQPKTVPECLLLHLETFVWEGYNGKRKEEKEVAQYILWNASRLKKVTFSETNCNSHERLKMLALASVVIRTSNSCHFEFE